MALPLEISSPLQVVQRLYKESGCPHSSDADFGVAARYTEMLKDTAALAQVPLLTAENADYLPNNSLVRFRGMVQDMSNPEYYHGAVQLSDGIWITTKFGDAIGVDLGTARDTKVWERRPVYLVPVPCESEWCKEASPAVLKESASAQHAERKRGREVTDGDTEMGEEAGAPQPSTNPDETQQQVDAQAAKQAKPSGPRNSATAGSSSTASPKDTWGDCIAYVYDQADNLMLHDVVEVVGVVSKMPELATWHMEAQARMDAQAHGPSASIAMGDELLAEQLAAHPPTSQVMRVHAVLIARRPAPQLPSPGNPSEVTALRSAALDLLKVALGGDALAAEYVLLAALGRVTSRSLGQGPMGITPLNLTKCPGVPEKAVPAAPVPQDSSTPTGSPFGQALHAALSALLPAVAYLPLSVDTCNSGSWAPRRDYETNKLSRSALQLAAGTLMLVDESVMRDGKLNEAGVGSLQALLDLIKDQTLSYDFQFYRQPVPVELPPLVLSEGRSIMHEALPLSLPLNPTQPLPSKEQVHGAVAAADPSLLTAVRGYLSTASRLQYALDDAMTDMLQQEFVAARKADASFSPDTFHKRLSVARLSALSFGESSLSEERWRYVLGLESAREARQRVV